MTGPEIVARVDATFENTLSIQTEMSTNQELAVDLGSVYPSGECKVLYNTSEYWNSRPQLVAKKGYLYVYSDHKQIDNEDIAGIKVGDGTSYLIDMPFIDKPLDEHVSNIIRHITSEEREFWNNKVRCFIDPENEQNLIFTTD